MSYEPTIWKKGDKVTSARLNKIENGIQGNDEALANKVDKVTGKGLSENDYTTAEKTKLAGIEDGATNVTIDSTLTQEGKAADAKEVGDQLADVKRDLTNHPETRTTEADNVDLDITDENGNVLARMSGGNIQTKNFNSADTSVIKATNSSDEVFDIADENGNVIERLVDGNIQTKNFDSKDFSILYYGKPNNNDILFTSDDVAEGDEIVLIFTVGASQQGCFIDILNSSDQRITYIGRPSIGNEIRYIEKYTIPANFAKAKAAAASNEMTVFVIAKHDLLFGSNFYEIWEALYQAPYLNAAITEYKYSADNKLANPLFISREKYNTDNPNDQIAVETALVRGTTGNAPYRIPTIAITNSGTVLIAALHMTNANGQDYGDFSIDVSRKASGGTWSISEVIPFEDYGCCWNPEFLVDRTNDRIYLFYGTSSRVCVWFDVTTAEGDYRYVYSDDDGITWSSPVSLKSLWDTEEYDFCIPSCTQGITLTDGTFVVPSFCKKGTLLNNRSFPLLLIKPVGGNWYFSSCASADGVKNLDECAVVEGLTENTIWLYCRPNSNYGNGPERGYNKFTYNITSDTFTHEPNSYFETNRHCCFSINKLSINSQALYLLTFIDSHTSKRENLTLWGSLDGNTWVRIYRINKPETPCYSVVTYYNGTIAVAYEDNLGNGEQISYQDISNLSTLIYNSVTKFIGMRITIQDRMQMLFNYATGID